MASKANANMLATQQKQQQLLISQYSSKGTGASKIELDKTQFSSTVDVSSAGLGRQAQILTTQANRANQGTPST